MGPPAIEAMKLRWSFESRRCLRRIYDYISQDSPTRAADFLLNIEKKAVRAAQFPSSGRVVPELQDRHVPPREILADSYRIMYRVQAGYVEIVLVIHAMRKLPSLPYL